MGRAFAFRITLLRIGEAYKFRNGRAVLDLHLAAPEAREGLELSFRVKIITPLQVDEADLARRQRRYGARAAPDTQIEVVGITDGPHALGTPGDLLFSEPAVFQEAVKTKPGEVDAILIDCIFDPAVAALLPQLDIPVFGPLRTTLSLVSLVSLVASR